MLSSQICTAPADDRKSSICPNIFAGKVLQESLTRNLQGFARFLEIASFSQGSVLNITAVSRETGIERKTVSNYFTILEDILLADRLPVFTKRAKRRLMSHSKFYYFDAGVYRAIRPSGPLGSPEEIEGAGLETLLFQELKSINEYFSLENVMRFFSPLVRYLP